MPYLPAPPPADWYPDPQGGSYLRFWNGAAWTRSTKPHGTSAVAPYAPPGAVLPYGAPRGGAAQTSGTGASVPRYVEPPIGAWRSRVDDRPLVRGMGDAIRVVFQKYAMFEGRATRSEFWYWQLFVGLTVVGTFVLLVVPFVGILFALPATAWGLAVLVPTYAVAVRRLRDAGYHWALIFLLLVPLGGIALIVLWCQPSRHS